MGWHFAGRTLAGSGFYPSYTHKNHHITLHLAALEPVFPRLAEAIRLGVVQRQLQTFGVPVSHTDFSRLT